MSNVIEGVFEGLGSLFGFGDDTDPEVIDAPVEGSEQIDIEGAKLRASKRRRQRLLSTVPEEETLGKGATEKEGKKPGSKKLLGS